MEKIKEFIAKYKSLKPLYQFAVNGLLVYLIWVVFYAFFRYHAFVDYFYNEATYYLTNSWLYSTKLFLNVLGYEAHIVVPRKLLVLQGTGGVILERGCLGRNMMGLFAGFILVYPGRLLTKLWYIPLGLAVIYVINILRIAGLSFTQLYYPEYLDINHHTVFKYTVYTAIFFLWVFWISKLNKPTEKKVEMQSQPELNT